MGRRHRNSDLIPPPHYDVSMTSLFLPPPPHSAFLLLMFPPVAVSVKREILQWMTPSEASKALAAATAVLKQNRCPSLDESARYSARGGDGGE